MKHINRIIVLLLLSFILIETCFEIIVHVNGDNDTFSDVPDFDFDTADHLNSEDYMYADDTSKVIDKGDVADEFDTAFDQMMNDKPNVFTEKEKRIRDELVRATKDSNNRRKFTQIMPILRSMSKQQRLVLAAVISAQTGQKELSLAQVEAMFGDRKKLILPIIFDIANLIRNAAKTKNPHLSEMMPVPQQWKRSLNISNESTLITQNEVFAPDNLLRDSRIQIELSNGNIKNISTDATKNNVITSPKPGSISDNYHVEKLNMTNFNGTKDQDAIESSIHYQVTLPRSFDSHLPHNITLEDYEDLALSQINGTGFEYTANGTNNENLPTPEMLISRYRVKPPFRKYSQPITIDGFKSCKRFGNLCLKVDDYPMGLIMGSIRRHKHAMAALLAEYTDNEDYEYATYLQDISDNSKRREDDNQPGTICPSIIRYARPQKARSASGEWKYIVNTGQHTQTIRLEKCGKPEEPCTYLTDNFRSRCVQVFNYHRLLSWDHFRGLHVDIFKVPTCCSCHIDGYKEKFPPFNNYGGGQFLSGLSNHDLGDDYRFAASNTHSTRYATIVSDDDDDSDDDDSSIAFQYSNGFKKSPHKFNKFAEPSLITSLTKPKFEKPKIPKLTSFGSPALEAYLTPPTHNDFDFKRGPSGGKRRRRPVRTHLRDQSISGSEFLPDITNIPNHDIITERSSTIKRKSTTPLDITTATKRVSTVNIPIPSISTAPTSDIDLGKRVNYNYHPIIDFFGDSLKSEKEMEDRMGYVHAEQQNWRPLQLDRRRKF